MWRPDMSRQELTPANRVQNLMNSMRGHKGFVDTDDGGKIRIILGPKPYANPDTGEIIGYQIWVKLFDANNNEVNIDPHRVFINPPDNSYYDSDLGRTIVDLSLPSARELVERDIKRSVISNPGHGPS